MERNQRIRSNRATKACPGTLWLWYGITSRAGILWIQLAIGILLTMSQVSLAADEADPAATEEPNKAPEEKAKLKPETKEPDPAAPFPSELGEDKPPQAAAAAAPEKPPLKPFNAKVAARIKRLQDRMKSLRDEYLDLKQETDTMNEGVSMVKPGRRGILFSGHLRFGYIQREGENSTFDTIVRFHPYWRIDDWTLCKADTQFALLERLTNVFLFFGQCSLIVNDYLTVKIGKFLSPFGYFQEMIHVEWTQKMPNEPLAVSDDIIAPTTALGIAVSGGIPIGPTRLVYSLYTSNGPRLVSDPLTPLDQGSLRYDNYPDNNSNKDIGGRIGFMPMLPAEIGISILRAPRVGDSDSIYKNIGATIRGLDLNYVGVVESIKSKLDFKFETVESKVDAADYGTGTYENVRRGAYWQFAYRPLLVKTLWLSKLELLIRNDYVIMPKKSPLNNVYRQAYGLNYWVHDTMGIKAAYEIARTELNASVPAAARLHGIPGANDPYIKYPEAKTRHNFLFQIAIGF